MTELKAATGYQHQHLPLLNSWRLTAFLRRPTVAEVRDSLEGWAAGSSIPGSHTNVTRDFLQPLFHRSGLQAPWQGSMFQLRVPTSGGSPCKQCPWTFSATRQRCRAGASLALQVLV